MADCGLCICRLDVNLKFHYSHKSAASSASLIRGARVCPIIHFGDPPPLKVYTRKIPGTKNFFGVGTVLVLFGCVAFLWVSRLCLDRFAQIGNRYSSSQCHSALFSLDGVKTNLKKISINFAASVVSLCIYAHETTFKSVFSCCSNSNPISPLVGCLLLNPHFQIITGHDKI